MKKINEVAETAFSLKIARIALSLYSGISFGVSLDDMVDFLNWLHFRDAKFCYQELIYNRNLKNEYEIPVADWLKLNVPRYKQIISFFDSLPESQKKSYLDSIGI